MVYEPRTYRRSVDTAGLASFEVVVAETDLLVAARSDLSDLARGLVESARMELQAFIFRNPRFAESFVPVEVPSDAPPMVVEMAEAASIAGVGPMASVAGAIAEHVGRGLIAASDEVIVENGGDTFLAGSTQRIVAVGAGASPLSGRVGIVLPGTSLPVSVCTSSATVGPSVSLGRADAACVVASSGAVADAVASMLGNRLHSDEDMRSAMEAALAVEGVRGVLVVMGEQMGVAGDIELTGVEPGGRD